VGAGLCERRVHRIAGGLTQCAVLDPRQHLVLMVMLFTLLLALVVLALFEPIAWVMVFPVVFIAAAMLDNGPPKGDDDG
jgi:hypothetical protein